MNLTPTLLPRLLSSRVSYPVSPDLTGPDCLRTRRTIPLPP